MTLIPIYPYVPLPHAGKTASSCGFEEASICGFLQADNSTDFHDWIRHSGATPSGWTGPRTDHTCGNDRGEYSMSRKQTNLKKTCKKRLKKRFFLFARFWDVFESVKRKHVNKGGPYPELIIGWPDHFYITAQRIGDIYVLIA